MKRLFLISLLFIQNVSGQQSGNSKSIKIINVTVADNYTGQLITVQCKPETDMIYEDKDRGVMLFCEKPHTNSILFEIWLVGKVSYLAKTMIHKKIAVTGTITDDGSGAQMTITDPKQVEILSNYYK
ncbi:hypothetical protein [Mucilaginibacter sp.]